MMYAANLYSLHDSNSAAAPRLRVRPRPLRVVDGPRKARDIDDAAEGSRRILVVGDHEPRRAALALVEEFEAELEEFGWADAVADHVDARVVGLVLAGHPPTAEPWKTVRTLAQLLRRALSGPTPPIAVLLDEGLDDETARRLYEAGASVAARLELDDDVPSTVEASRAGLLARSFGAHLARGPVSGADAALSRQARIRLLLASPRFSRIEVEVRGGQAVASGHLDSLVRRAEVVEVLDALPGVTDIDTSGVRITVRAPDQQLFAATRAAIEASVASPRTVSAWVEGGRIVLAGSVASRDELDGLLDRLRRLIGARKIENDVVVSPEQRDRDRRVARTVSGRLSALGIDDVVDSEVFGPFAVLRGSLDAELDPDAVKDAIRQISGVQHVVDELDTSP